MKNIDEMRAEYNFAAMKGGIRAKYVRRLREHSNVVVLEPEIADAFPNEEAVNQALRRVLNTARAVRRTGGLADQALHAAMPGSRKARRKPRH